MSVYARLLAVLNFIYVPTSNVSLLHAPVRGDMPDKTYRRPNTKSHSIFIIVALECQILHACS